MKIVMSQQLNLGLLNEVKVVNLNISRLPATTILLGCVLGLP